MPAGHSTQQCPCAKKSPWMHQNVRPQGLAKHTITRLTTQFREAAQKRVPTWKDIRENIKLTAGAMSTNEHVSGPPWRSSG